MLLCFHITCQMEYVKLLPVMRHYITSSGTSSRSEKEVKGLGRGHFAINFTSLRF